MKVTFTRDFDFSPAAFKGQVTTAYRAGTTVTVTHECAEAAVAAGAGEVVEPEEGGPARKKGKS